MLLKVSDRLTLLGLLPPMEGNIVLLRMVRELQAEASFTSEESEALGLRQVGPQWLWKENQDKEIEVPELVKTALIASLKALSDRGKLNMAQLGLYEMLEGEGKDAAPSSTEERNNGENRNEVPNRAQCGASASRG